MFVFGTFLEGFFKSAFKYAKLEVIDVNKMNNKENAEITPKKLVPENK